MRARELMSTPVITVSPETSLKDVAEKMAAHNVSGVPGGRSVRPPRGDCVRVGRPDETRVSGTAAGSGRACWTVSRTPSGRRRSSKPTPRPT